MNTTSNYTILEIVANAVIGIAWIFGIALSLTDSLISLFFTIIFPPYAWVIVAAWIIEIINGKICG